MAMCNSSLKHFLIALVVALAAASCHLQTLAATPEQAIAPAPFPERERVAALINQLGKSRYVVRRAAEQELLEIGMAAFDQIDAASKSVDPEIAANCQYLLSQMTVRWTRRDDPPQVAILLEDYAELEDMYRVNAVRQLATLPENMGIAPLCRICRYDRSDIVSQEAALALINVGHTREHYLTGSTWEVGDFKVAMGPSEAKTMRDGLGPSVRRGAHWIRLFALQLEAPAEAVPYWNEAIEQVTVEADSPEASEELGEQVALLLWNLARLQLQLEDKDAFVQVAERLAERRSEQLEETISSLVEWIIAAEQPELVDVVLEKFEPRLKTSRAGLYLMAAARADQGKLDLAEELAEAAFKFAPTDIGEDSLNSRNAQARALMSEGRVEWGRREYRDVIAKASPASMPHVVAVYDLANSFHDWGLDDEAVGVLKPLTHLLQTDRNVRMAFDEMRNESYYYNFPSYEKLLALEYYFAACHLASQEGDTRAEQWSNLQKSIKYDREDVDVLIAMYRASEGNEANRKLAMSMIEAKCRKIEQEIDTNPTEAQHYNEWAWLVGNTEGDFEKAIRYSHQSIQILDDSQNDAGLLDTLARCYFAAGDIENALKYQTEAVEKMPHSQVLRRALEEFQEAARQQPEVSSTP